MDIEKMSNLLGADLAKKVYEDGASESMKELGKVATDLIKTLRLFTAPIQLASAYQDRLAKYLDKVRNNVKPENQIEAPAHIAGVVIDRLKYLEDDNYLTDLYLNLLTRAIDKERINEAHPAFVHLIDQLSPDEAMLLYLMTQTSILLDYRQELGITDRIPKDSTPFIIDKITIDTDKISFIENLLMYIEHLKSLNLIRWKITQEGILGQEGFPTYNFTKSILTFTEFGEMFTKACIPDNGFTHLSNI